MKTYLYQWRVLFLMVLAWSFAGLAHNCIAFLFPFFSVEFNLYDKHNGYLSATLALFWALAIIVCGRKADKVGHVKVIVPGLMVGASGLIITAFVNKAMLFYIVTALIGFGCGAMCSPSLSFLAEQCMPEKRGLFYGIAMSSYTFIGSAMGSLFFTRLGGSIIGWRGCYIIIGLLVFSSAFCIYFFGKNIPRGKTSIENFEKKYSFKDLLMYKNVITTTVLACFAMMWYFSVASYTILYLINAKSFTITMAGTIFAGFGIGGFIGEFSIPIFSDYVGRKYSVCLATLLGFISYLLFLHLDVSTWMMSILLGIASFFMSGAMALLNSVIPSESVPEVLVATATSFTPAAGELTGGVLGPVLIGTLISIFDIEKIMFLLLIIPLIIILGVFRLKETAPIKLKNERSA